MLGGPGWSLAEEKISKRQMAAANKKKTCVFAHFGIKNDGVEAKSDASELKSKTLDFDA